MPRRYWPIMVVAALALLAGQAVPAWAQVTSAPAAIEEEGTAGGEPQPEAAGQPGTQPAAQPTAPKKKPGSMFDSMWPLIIMVGGFFLLYMWMGRSRRKQQRQRKEMLATLKKGDKVTTIGGIIGTVIEVRDDEVMVKVDETGNVRMKFARWSVRGVGETGKAENPAESGERPQGR